MLTVYSARGEPVCGLTREDIDEFCLTQVEGKEDALSFRIHPDHPKFRYLEEETRLAYEDNSYLVKGMNRNTTVTVTCALDLDFLKGRIYRPYASETQALKTVLANHLPPGWTVKGADGIAIKRTIAFDIATDYDVLNQTKETYGVTFRWNTRDKILTVADPDQQEFLGEYLTEELNLKRLSCKGDTASFATRLYCYGKDGMTVSSVNGGKEYVEDHTYSDKIICAYWVDERYTVPENLKKDAQERLASLANPARSYECGVVDLAKMRPEYGFLEFSLGKSVALLDSRRGTRMVHTIVQYDQYPFDPTRNKVVLSNTAAQLQDMIHRVQDDVKDLKEQTGKYIKELIDTDREFMRKFTIVDESFSQVRQTAQELTARVTDEVNHLSSEIEINRKAIRTKVTEDDVSLIIEQSSDAVMYAFNGISSVIQMQADGFHFYSRGSYIGKIGTDNDQGLVFDLDEGTYMAWNKNGDGRLVYYPYDMGRNKAGLHTANIYGDIVNLENTLYMNGNDIEEVSSLKTDLLNNTNFSSWRDTVNRELSDLDKRIDQISKG